MFDELASDEAAAADDDDLHVDSPVVARHRAPGVSDVVFVAHWCPHCNAEVPVLLEWRDSGAIPEELQIFGVSTAVTDTRPNFPPDEWLADFGWDWPTMADDAQATAFRAYGGTGFPYFVIVGADGTVKARNPASSRSRPSTSSWRPPSPDTPVLSVRIASQRTIATDRTATARRRGRRGGR